MDPNDIRHVKEEKRKSAVSVKTSWPSFLLLFPGALTELYTISETRNPTIDWFYEVRTVDPQILGRLSFKMLRRVLQKWLWHENQFSFANIARSRLTLKSSGFYMYPTEYFTIMKPWCIDLMFFKNVNLCLLRLKKINVTSGSYRFSFLVLSLMKRPEPRSASRPPIF